MARCPAGHESEASDYCDTCGLVIGGEAPGSAQVSAASAPAATSLSASLATAVATEQAASGGAGCPVCQAERNGRFCEECGYDFDLAEAMPQVTLTPGVGPAAPDPVAAPVPDPLARTLVEPPPEPEAETVAEPANEPAAQGLDLDAELARAEAEAAESQSTATVLSTPAEPAEALAASPEPASSAPLSLASAFSASTELSLVVDADRDYYKAQVERGDIIESEFPFPKYPHERRFTFTESPVRIGRASASRGIAPEIDLTGPPLDPAVSHLHAQLLRHDEGWVVVDLDSANGTRLNDAEEPLAAETEIPVKQGDRIHLGVWTTITVE